MDLHITFYMENAMTQFKKCAFDQSLKAWHISKIVKSSASVHLRWLHVSGCGHVKLDVYLINQQPSMSAAERVTMALWAHQRPWVEPKWLTFAHLSCGFLPMKAIMRLSLGGYVHVYRSRGTWGGSSPSASLPCAHCRGIGQMLSTRLKNKTR